MSNDVNHVIQLTQELRSIICSPTGKIIVTDKNRYEVDECFRKLQGCLLGLDSELISLVKEIHHLEDELGERDLEDENLARIYEPVVGVLGVSG